MISTTKAANGMFETKKLKPYYFKVSSKYIKYIKFFNENKQEKLSIFRIQYYEICHILDIMNP